MKKHYRLIASVMMLMILLSPAIVQAGETIPPKHLEMYNIDSGFYLLWDAVPGATSYVIYLRDGAYNRFLEIVADDGIPKYTHALKNTEAMTPGKTYVLSIVASDGTALGSTDPFVYEIMDEDGPFISDIPKNLQLFAMDSGYYIFWEALQDALGYNIYLGDGVKEQLIGTVEEDNSKSYLFAIDESLMVEGHTYVLSVGAANGTAKASLEPFVYSVIPESSLSEEGE